jgi:hypothetical protein
MGTLLLGFGCELPDDSQLDTDERIEQLGVDEPMSAPSDELASMVGADSEFTGIRRGGIRRGGIRREVAQGNMYILLRESMLFCDPPARVQGEAKGQGGVRARARSSRQVQVQGLYIIPLRLGTAFFQA